LRISSGALVVSLMAFDRKELAQFADGVAAAAGAALPWSTSATSILLVIWLITLGPTLDIRAIWREVKSPAGGLPVLLWLFAVVGMLWADASWPERFAGLSSFHRLLAIPLFLAQFRRSQNAWWVLCGFLSSSLVLLLASWGLALGVISWHTNWAFGVVVHDVIAQSTIFLVCAFALTVVAGACWRRGNWFWAVAAAVLTVLFFANLVFVAHSRADIVGTLVLIVWLGWRWSGWRGAVLASVALGVLSVAAWTSSPYLRFRVQSAVEDVRTYQQTGAHNDVGDHIEFIKKSIGFVREAPVVGHGTGSIPQLFRRSSVGQTGAAGVVSVNPHNQILAVAIQLGILGGAMLVGMWGAHLILFGARALTGWIGTVVIVENVVSSLTSSHLFDFVHGWLYVLCVGIVGGLCMQERDGSKLD
jgi:O-antigen ligase